MPSVSQTSADPLRVIVYIDGYNLYHGLKAKNWRRLYWLDLWRLGEELLKPGQRLGAVRYFTTRIKGPDDSRNRQNDYLEAITIGRVGLSIDYGHFLEKTAKCRNCGATWPRHEEKKTDVNIACRLVEDAMDDLFDVAIIVSGDSDLVPPIKLVKRRWTLKRLIVAFPPQRFSESLKKAAHGHLAISEHKLAQAQMPDVLMNSQGFEIRRPAHWQ
ncbi:MAG: NYN domain-containing protein [Phycisphaeraceae bacterium]|nr:NYN domain-containing protein [Phycisphaeraceae bacterium]